MGKIAKPKKPNLVKPKLPRQPTEPSEWMPATLVATLEFTRYDEYNQDDSISETLSQYEIPHDGGILSFDCDDMSEDWVNLQFAKRVPHVIYQKSLAAYKKKLKTYEEKVAKLQPEINAYAASMAEYKVKLLSWETEKAQEALRQAHIKLSK